MFLVPSGPGGGNCISMDPAGEICSSQLKEERDEVSERLREQEGENLTVKKETEETRRRLREEIAMLRRCTSGGDPNEHHIIAEREEGRRDEGEGERAEGERPAEVAYLHSRARGKAGHVTLSTKSVVV